MPSSQDWRWEVVCHKADHRSAEERHEWNRPQWEKEIAPAPGPNQKRKEQEEDSDSGLGEVDPFKRLEDLDEVCPTQS